MPPKRAAAAKKKEEKKEDTADLFKDIIFSLSGKHFPVLEFALLSVMVK